MQIYVRVKALGRRRDVLQPAPYAIPDGIASLRALLSAVAAKEAACYNQKGTEPQLIPYLTAEQIDAQAGAGKVSFGGVFSDKKADTEEAVRTVLQCWQDGLVRVFLDETELLDLDAPLSIPENAVVTFIRLTFLAGRMW